MDLHALKNRTSGYARVFLAASAMLGNAVAIFLATVPLQSCGQRKPDATVRVNAAEVKQQITPWLYGACIEDVNHEIYGGLYDQKIFGESFEEPAPGPLFEGFSTYEGVWEMRSGDLFSRAHPGAKLVYDAVDMSRGIVQTELRFDGRGDNAGLLLRVSLPGNGADNFFGYEISLAADGKKVVIGKHKNNFTHIQDIPVACNPQEWNTLGASMDNGEINVLLNGAKICTFNDDDTHLKAGSVALRTWNSNVRFRNLTLSSGETSENVAFRPLPLREVSSPWDGFETGEAKSAFALDRKGGYNGPNAQMIGLVSGNGTVGIANAGLNRWGIAVRKGQKFEGRLYLKTSGLKGTVTVALQSADGKTEYAKQEIGGITGSWQKYPFELVSDADDPKARFSVSVNAPGKLWIDQVTLMTTGSDRFKGLPYRNDIAEAMVKQGLTFLRYGGTMVNVPGYRFKKMIGDPDKRPPYTGHWYRYSTNGFGIEDFLKVCEAAGFTPSFAVNIEEDPQDMADMIEYLNGSVTSEWGGKRAENGHPEPYGIKYIGIGNEEVLFNGDRADEYDHYVERFNLLYDAIKSKDPSVSLVSTAWWRPDSPNMERVFKALDGKAEYWDYHPWADQLSSGREVETELRRMKDLFRLWNPATNMKCAIFEENGNLHNMQRVLGHVTLQNAVRRMGDFVLTSCAANALQPYRQNDNGWNQGQIFFTPSRVWGMPPYYAQQMASANHQPFLVQSEVTDPANKLDVTATRSEDGSTLVLHVANTGPDTIQTRLQIDNFGKVNFAKSLTLSGALTDINTPEEPGRIVPVEKQMWFLSDQVYPVMPYSYTVFVYSSEK